MSYVTEDAKTDWMKLVKKHKKKQKGLPALSTLNTNAGNVEHNINIFNMTSSPIDTPSNNPVSGPFGGDACSGGDGGAMGESLLNNAKGENNMRNKINLHYPELEVEEVATNRIIRGDYYTPDEVETIDLTLDYTYSVDKQDILEFLQELEDVQKEYLSDELSDDEYWNILEANFDKLFEMYKEQILDHFEQDAIEEVQETYVYDTDQDIPEPDYDSYDDEFDMSVRTLL